MKNVVLESLAKPFNLKEREGLAGKRFKYVASEDILERMNTVFKGNWNVDLMSSEIIEDQLLVLVKVSVLDEETGKIFYHDGYASYPVFRFTSGQNKGKLIDIGNSYRSAMSKAIKTACSRWGVALFLDEDASATDTVTSDDIPATPTNPVVETPPDIPTAVVEPSEPVLAPSVPDVPIPAGPINNPEKMESPNPWPDAPSEHDTRQDAQGGPVVEEPVFTDDNVVIPSSVNVPPNIEAPPSIVGEALDPNEAMEKLTSVQKVAIESLMDINKIEFKDLFMKAIPEHKVVPASIKEISYLDAVKLIQTGNHLKPVPTV